MPKSKPTKKKRPDFNITNADSSEESESPKIRTLEMRKYEALHILKGQNAPSKFNYREKEINQITNCIQSFLEGDITEGRCKVLMVTGSPGAGKTLCTTHILRKSPYKVINLNANVIRSLKEVQTILQQQLLPEQLAQKSKELSTLQLMWQLEKYPPQPCILYIEQVELFLKYTPDIFSEDFFSLFSSKKLSLMLIGISNTIDTLEKYGERLKITLPQIKNIIFQPYTILQLRDFMLNKFQEVKKKTNFDMNVSEKLLMYVANKLEAYKRGDLRIVFEFLKEVGTILLFKKFKDSEPISPVTIEIVNQILCKLKNEKDRLITQIPFQQQIILVALYMKMKKTDAISITEAQLKKDVKEVYDSLTMNPKKQLEQELYELESYGFITRKKKTNYPDRCLLKINLMEIEVTFKEHALLSKFISD